MRHFIDIVEQRLSEISISYPSDYTLTDYLKYFRDQNNPPVVVSTFRDAELRLVEDAERLHLGFFDGDNNLFSYLQVFENEVNGYPCKDATV
jgi:hypothetical protein